MEISGSAAAWLAVSVGISSSMAWNVPNQSPSTRFILSKLTMAEQTPTFTSTVRSEDTVRGLAKEPFVSDWWLETVLDTRAVVTRTLGRPPPVES